MHTIRDMIRNPSTARTSNSKLPDLYLMLGTFAIRLHEAYPLSILSDPLVIVEWLFASRKRVLRVTLVPQDGLGDLCIGGDVYETVVEAFFFF